MKLDARRLLNSTLCEFYIQSSSQGIILWASKAALQTTYCTIIWNFLNLMGLKNSCDSCDNIQMHNFNELLGLEKNQSDFLLPAATVNLTDV